MAFCGLIQTTNQIDLIQFKHFKKPKGAYSSDESLAKRITFDGSPSKRRFKISRFVEHAKGI